MKVTQVNIRRLLPHGRVKAIASVVIDGLLAIHELKVVETDHFFVSFPGACDKNGKYRDVVHPIDCHGRMLIEGAVLKEYVRFIGRE